MIEFEKITLKNIMKFSKFAEKQTYRVSEFAIGTIYMWADYFKTEYAVIDDYLVFKYEDPSGDVMFSYPIYGGDEQSDECVICRIIGEVKDYAAENGYTLMFANVPVEVLKECKVCFPKSEIITNRDWSDYLYLYDDLAEFKGRKYSKRNHISRFKREYPSYQFLPITKENIQKVIDEYAEFFLDENAIYEDNESSHIKQEEARKTKDVLEHFFELPVFGWVLLVEDKVIGFSIGEYVGDTLIVHIEKALVEYEGSYTIIANHFAVECKKEGIDFINREDDAGSQGLRKSKLSYLPVALLDKYVIRVLA